MTKKKEFTQSDIGDEEVKWKRNTYVVVGKSDNNNFPGVLCIEGKTKGPVFFVPADEIE